MPKGAFVFGRNLMSEKAQQKNRVRDEIQELISQGYLPLHVLVEKYGYSFVLNLTQALWALMVALSVVKLTVLYNFNFKNILFLGVLYSIIIHGLKAFVFRVFLFPYSDPTFGQYILHLLNRFFYGSSLVMTIVIILGVLFIKLKNNPEVRRSAKRL